LISEYLAMDEDAKNNRMTFKVDKDNTLVKFLVENDDIYMSLRDTKQDS